MKRILFFICMSVAYVQAMEHEISANDAKLEKTRNEVSTLIEEIYHPFYNKKMTELILHIPSEQIIFEQEVNLELLEDTLKKRAQFIQDGETFQAEHKPIHDLFSKIIEKAKDVSEMDGALKTLETLYASKCTQHIKDSKTAYEILHANEHDYQMCAHLHLIRNALNAQ